MHVANLATPLEHSIALQTKAGGFSPSFEQSIGP